MLHFYGVILWVSIEPSHLGGYNSYFELTSRISCGQEYTVSLEAYGGRASKIMSLSRLIHIRSAYHP